MGDIRNLFNEAAISKIEKDYYKPIKTTLFVLINAGQIIAGLMFAELMFANFL